MGTHAKGPVREFFMGSVSQYIVSHCHCDDFCDNREAIYSDNSNFKFKRLRLNYTCTVNHELI